MKNGEKFLQLNKKNELVSTYHAYNRLTDILNKELTDEEITELFLTAKQLTIKEMAALGYRPSYGKRKKKGENSWYFKNTVNTKEIVFVVSQTKNEDNLIWITTYTPNKMTLEFRKGSHEVQISTHISEKPNKTNQRSHTKNNPKHIGGNINHKKNRTGKT